MYQETPEEKALFDLKTRLTNQYRHEPWFSSAGIGAHGVILTVATPLMDNGELYALQVHSQEENFIVKHVDKVERFY